MKTEKNAENDCISELVAACREYPHGDGRDVADIIANPQWDDAGRIGDWRNAVDDAVIAIWHKLPTQARLVAYLAAAQAVYHEDAE